MKAREWELQFHASEFPVIMFGSGIHEAEITLLLLIAMIALLAAAAQRLRVPYPIVLLLGGLTLSFLPWIPKVSIDPSFIFLVVLPPLLFASTINIGWAELRENSAHILMLGLGLVAFTVIAVAAAMHLIVQGFNWRVGAVLGAVLSTTDTIAVGAVARRVGLPYRILQVIEGESLTNDAMGLLALQFTSALVVSGTIPTIFAGIGQFIWLIVAGIFSGLVVAVPIAHFERRLRSVALQLLVSIVTPYFAYLLGEGMHGSGVLATVACGLYFGRMQSKTFSSQARLESKAVWDTIDFSLNGLVFILIGLQLPSILNGMGDSNWTQKLLHAAMVCALLISLRFMWVFAGARAVQAIRNKLFHREGEYIPNRVLTVVSWSGMRGVLTLAAALSLPSVIANGQPFPERQAIIFFSYAVILVTLLGQGLSLPALIRRLNVAEPEGVRESALAARAAIVRAGLERLQQIRDHDQDIEANRTAYELMERFYRDRLRTLEPEQKEEEEQSERERQQNMQQIAYSLRQAEREELMRLRAAGRIRDNTLREVERELDLLDVHWNSA
jgi:CPA1 family monovalent cation:H+ antiporter